MKAKEGVLEFLNQVLRSELTTVHQYLLHGALCKNWGYERLHDHYSYLANEEVQHSAGLMNHILYLNGIPDVAHLDAVTDGQNVEALFRADVEFEREDVIITQKGHRPLRQREGFHDTSSTGAYDRRLRRTC